MSQAHQAIYDSADDPETCNGSLSFRVNLRQSWRQPVGKWDTWSWPTTGTLWKSSGTRRTGLSGGGPEEPSSCAVRGGFLPAHFQLISEFHSHLGSLSVPILFSVQSVGGSWATVCDPVSFYLGTAVNSGFSAITICDLMFLDLNQARSRHWHAWVLWSYTKQQGTG